MGGVVPYRYGRWPRLGRAEVEAARRLRRALPERLRQRCEEAVGSLLGAEVRCAVHLPRACAEGPTGAPLGVALASDPERVPFLLEVDPALARLVIDRLLGGTGASVPAHLVQPLSLAERGVLAYVLARVLVDVGDGQLMLALEAPAPERTALVTRADMTIHLAGRVGRARVWVMPDALPPPSEQAPTRRALDALMDLPVELVLDVGRGHLPARELCACRRGDVFVPDELWGGDSRHEPCRLRGRVLGAQRATWWWSFEGQALRLMRVDRPPAPTLTEGKVMTTPPHGTRPLDLEPPTDAVGAARRPPLDLVGDAPVELAVEIARLRLPLEELARLQVGEVLTTGQPVGERVTLRAGDRAIALGELVEVEGQVGVRLVRTWTASRGAGE